MGAKECHTLVELQAWREATLSQLKFVPEAYRGLSNESIQREYRENADRIAEEKARPQDTTSADTLSNGNAMPKTAQQVNEASKPKPETTGDDSLVGTIASWFSPANQTANL